MTWLLISLIVHSFKINIWQMSTTTYKSAYSTYKSAYLLPRPRKVTSACNVQFSNSQFKVTLISGLWAEAMPWKFGAEERCFCHALTGFGKTSILQLLRWPLLKGFAKSRPMGQCPAACFTVHIPWSSLEFWSEVFYSACCDLCSKMEGEFWFLCNFNRFNPLQSLLQSFCCFLLKEETLDSYSIGAYTLQLCT